MMKRPRIFIAWAIPAVFLFSLGIGTTQFCSEASADETDMRRFMDPRSGDPTEPDMGHELPFEGSYGIAMPDDDPQILARKRNTPWFSSLAWLLRVLKL
ncbi:MAG: hypothetical protein ACREOU_00100 [Candidatus Eiseniibacteriota bacterium]